MAINSFKDVEAALASLQAQLNAAFGQQAAQIGNAIGRNDRDFAGLAAEIKELQTQSASRAFQKGYDPSNRQRTVGGLVNSSLSIVQDGETTTYNPSDQEGKTVTITYTPPYNDSELRESLSQEAQEREDADAALQQQIEAFAGALIYIGTIDLDVGDVTQAALDARAQELGKYPPAKGYVLVDNNSNDWWHDGAEWVNIGYYDVAQATNSSLGVVSGSTDSMKVSVDLRGEMSVNGLQTALDGKQSALTAGANIQISGNVISATDTITVIPPSALGVPVKAINYPVANPYYPLKDVFYYIGSYSSYPSGQTPIRLDLIAGMTNADIGKIYTFLSSCSYYYVQYCRYNAEIGSIQVNVNAPVQLMFLYLGANSVPCFEKVA